MCPKAWPVSPNTMIEGQKQYGEGRSFHRLLFQIFTHPQQWNGTQQRHQCSPRHRPFGRSSCSDGWPERTQIKRLEVLKSVTGLNLTNQEWKLQINEIKVCYKRILRELAYHRLTGESILQSLMSLASSELGGIAAARRDGQRTRGSGLSGGDAGQGGHDGERHSESTDFFNSQKWLRIGAPNLSIYLEFGATK